MNNKHLFFRDNIFLPPNYVPPLVQAMMYLDMALRIAGAEDKLATSLLGMIIGYLLLDFISFLGKLAESIIRFYRMKYVPIRAMMNNMPAMLMEIMATMEEIEKSKRNKKNNSTDNQ